MTRRERLERKLEKRREWAEKAEQRAGEKFTTARDAVKHIPPGQPILVGHHSEKRHRRDLERCDQRMRAGFEQRKKAEHHRDKAAGLAAQLDHTIFSDDADAIEQLEVRVGEREAERDRWKAFNTSCRKGTPDMSLLDDAQRTQMADLARVCPYQIGKKGQAPTYILSNLGATIRKDRERIKEIRARMERAQRAQDAGGVLIVTSGDYCSITFAEKPNRATLKELKAHGFHWRGGSWSGRTSDLPASLRSEGGVV